MTATLIVAALALLGVGGLSGFALALVARRPAPTLQRAARRAAPVVVVEPSEDSPPSLLPHDLPALPPRPSAPLQAMAIPVVVYDPDAEDEDDVPTTLYRHTDEDLDALLAEFDTGHR